MLKRVVGLFGTCGGSRWREDIVIPILQQRKVEFFNPVVAEWTEEAMKNEADHAATDQVVMMVITDETSAIASMAESGWIALQASLRGQTLIMVLQDFKNDVDGLRINKTRKLLREHIAALPTEAPVELYDDISTAAYQAADAILMS